MEELITNIVSGGLGTAPIAYMAVRAVLKRLHVIEMALVANGTLKPEQLA